MASLLLRAGAEPMIAPSLREVGLESNPAAAEFGRRVVVGQLDGSLLVMLTGVGTETLLEAAARVVPREELIAGLHRLTVIVRGPKPVPVCKSWGVRIDLRAPEPNTWREVLQTLDAAGEPLSGRRVVVQEYGAPSPELCAALTARGAVVEPLAVYRWELPEDCGPLRDAVRALAGGQFDLLLFTSAQQVRHVLLIAEELGLTAAVRAACRRCVVGSIGPTTTEALREAGLPADFEPSHARMGHLATESCRFARQRLDAAGERAPSGSDAVSPGTAE